MESKTFDLLSKMYGEFSEFRTEAKQRLESIEVHVLRIENKQNKDSKALFDGYKQTYENTMEIKKDIKDIIDVINIHEVKLIKVK